MLRLILGALAFMGTSAQTMGYDWNGFSASGLGCGSDSGVLNVGLGQSLPPGATGLKVKQISFAIYGTNSLPAFIQLHGSTSTPRLSTSTAVQCCGTGCDLAVQVTAAGYSWYNSPCGQPACGNANKWYYMDFSGTAVGTTEQTGISEATFYNSGGSQIGANMINLGSGSVFFMSYTVIIPSPTPTPSVTKSPVSPSLTASETASTSISRSVTASGSTERTTSRSVTASRSESRSPSTTMSASRAPSVTASPSRAASLSVTQSRTESPVSPSASPTTDLSLSTSVSATTSSSSSISASTDLSLSTSVSATTSSSSSISASTDLSLSTSVSATTSSSSSISATSDVSQSTSISQSQSTSVSSSSSASATSDVSQSRSVSSSSSISPTTDVSQSISSSVTSSLSSSIAASRSSDTTRSPSVSVSISPTPQSFQQISNINTTMSATSTPQFMITAYATTSPTYSPTQNATLPIVVVDVQGTSMTTTNALLGTTLALIIVAVALAAARYLPTGWAQRFRRMIPQSTIDNFKRDPLGSVTAMVNDPKSILKNVNIQIPDSVKSIADMVPKDLKDKFVPDSIQKLITPSTATVPHVEADTGDEKTERPSTPEDHKSSRRAPSPTPIGEVVEHVPEPEKEVETVTEDSGVIVNTHKDSIIRQPLSILQINPEDLAAVQAYLNHKGTDYKIIS